MHLENKIWRVPEPTPVRIAEMSSALGVGSITASVLVNRGLSVEEAREFLSPDLTKLHDPFLLNDMDIAVKRLVEARSGKEEVVVYGDYDVDGVTSCALLVRVLRSLGFRVRYYIPKRLEEGYGLNDEAVQTIQGMGAGLIVTVDCGVSALREVALAKKLGMDVIVTDHHQPGDLMPDALAVINPNRRDSNYPFPYLAGVGVAFKLAQALLSHFGVDSGTDYLDLVALGTIADVVPLYDENRIFAKYGLQQMSTSSIPGLQALLDVSGLSGRELTSGHVGFVLAPRINALGRMADAAAGVDLLLSEDIGTALPIAREMDARNRERQALEAAVLEEALDVIDRDGLGDDTVLVVAGDGWHHGVIGIVASRILERFHRPVIMIGLDGDTGRGSCRSIPEFNMYQGLCQCADDLLAFGGHPAAAGLSIERSQIDKFRRHINEVASASLSPKDLIPKIEADAWVSLSSVDIGLIDELSVLAPFGPGNPEPVLACRGVRISESRGVGKDANHLKMIVCDSEGCRTGAIGWRMANLLPDLSLYETVNIAFRPSINEWNGSKTVQLELKDIHADRGSRYAAFLRRLHEKWGDYMREWLESVAGGDPIHGTLCVHRTVPQIMDGRGSSSRLSYILRLAGETSDTIAVAVNHPLEAVRLSQSLAGQDPDLSCRTAYFHRGVQAVGETLEEMAADGQVRVIVWADGHFHLDGVEHLVFYDLPAYEGQLLRAVEVLKPRYVHLVFGHEGIPLTRSWLEAAYPDREQLIRVYNHLTRVLANQTLPLGRIIQLVGQREGGYSWQVCLAASLRIFREIGLLKRAEVTGNPDRINTNGGEAPSYALAAPSSKLDLQSSISYNVGMEIRRQFTSFAQKILQDAGSSLFPIWDESERNSQL